MSFYGYKSSFTPDGTHAELFRLWLAANLITWTVGPMNTYSSGTTERNYFTLTHNTTGAIILVYVPNGSSSTIDSGIYSSKKGSYISNTQARPLAFAYDPKGEIDPSLNDPLTSGFWTTGVGNTHNIDLWYSGIGLTYTYVIESDTIPVFAIYCSQTDGASPHGFYLAGELYEGTNDVFAKDGVFVLDVQTGTPPTLGSVLISFWMADKAYRAQYSATYPFATPLSYIGDSLVPLPSGYYPSAKIFTTYDSYAFAETINPLLIQTFPRTTEKFNQKGTNIEMINLHRDLITLWPASFAVPGA